MLKYENDYLNMYQTSKNKFTMEFLDSKENYTTSEEFLIDTFISYRNKRISAYMLVPIDSIKVSKKIMEDIDNPYQDKLVGGILTDSIERAYGIADRNGIPGYSCSIYWLLSKEEIKQITNYIK